MISFKALVLCGDGINCEYETARALSCAGFSPQIIHINRLIKNPQVMQQFHLLALPGGFSFGDEIRSGKILALKIKKYLFDELLEFINQEKLIIGICNGFQTLLQLNLLPDLNQSRCATLAKNFDDHFIDRWTPLQVHSQSHCVWIKDLPNTINLPIRHGEGRIVLQSDHVFQKLLENGQIPLTYQDNPNGSQQQIAALCNPSGTILGLMPHPEAAIHRLLSPSFDEAHGLNFFQNAYQYLYNKEVLHEPNPYPQSSFECQQ